MRKLLLPVLLLVALLAACGGGTPEATTTTQAPQKLKVVATTTVVADFIKVVGSDYVDVHTMVKAETDPHNYQTVPADMGALADAAVVVKSGAELDSWVDAALKTSGGRGKLIDASVDVRKRPGDPHVWHSPQNAKSMVDTIRRALIEADNAHEEQYATSGRAFSSQIDGLERDIERSFEAITSNKLVTHHASMGYYAAEFGLQYAGSVIPGSDPDIAPTPEHTAELVQTVKAQGVRAIFAEHLLPVNTAEAVATAAGVKLASGSDALYVDGLGPEGSPGATYLAAMRHNTGVLVRHLS